jgi:predicted neuraminidase
MASKLLALLSTSFLVLSLAVVAQPPARGAGPSTPLIDPSIARHADGVERRNARHHFAEAYLPILYPSSHAANLLQLKNGDVLCVWFSGSWEGNSEVGIVMSRRHRGSHNWGPVVLIDRSPGVSYQNPVIFQEPDGVIDLYHSTQGAGAGENNAHVLHLVSRDNGVTWSRPELLFAKPGAFTRHPVVVLSDGSWLLPLTFIGRAPGAAKVHVADFSATEITVNRGLAWQECVMAGTQDLIQPSVASLAPARLLAFFRSRAGNFIYTSTSADGCTWTAPAPTVLPNNDASVQAFRLHNGHLVVAFDNSSKIHSDGLRKPLSVALSLDDGKTWPYVRDIETGRPGYGLAQQTPRESGREEYSYPSIIQTRDGEILVAFTYQRQTIKVVSFREDWIRQGKSVGEFKGQH